MERWRPVPDYEDCYEVSDRGRFRRTINRFGNPSGRVLRLGDRAGYAQAILCKDAVRAAVSPHRVVWSAFNGPIPAGMQINHKNGDKRDNRLANLEVCTPSENTCHALRVLGVPQNPLPHVPGAKNGRAVLRDEDLPKIKKMRDAGMSQQKIANAFGVNQTTISRVLLGQTWRY